MSSSAAPIHRIRTAVGDPALRVSGYDLARRVLDDDRLGRSHPDPGRAARTGESALFGGPMGEYETERADHRRMRELLRPHFSPGRMRRLRPRVEALTDGLLDRVAATGPPADLQAGLALPLPIAVICELLGVPYDDRDAFHAWTRAAADTADRDRSERGLAELFDYGRHLVRRKRRAGGDDVITALALDPEVGTDEAAMLAMFLLFAGHETTVVAIGLGLWRLLAHPDQWRELTGDPGRLDAAIEEILRVSSTGGSPIPRYARTDLALDGVPVRAGELVVVDLAAANHDPAAFPDPGAFAADRTDAAHLSFGHGSRYCLGAPLARVELHAVFGRLTARFPGLRPAVDLAGIAFERNALTSGPAELPVVW